MCVLSTPRLQRYIRGVRHPFASTPADGGPVIHSAHEVYADFGAIEYVCCCIWDIVVMGICLRRQIVCSG